MTDCHIGKPPRLESHNLIHDKVNASDLALGMVSSLVSSPVFANWFRQPAAGSRFVIAALDEDLQRRLGAQQKAVLLSDETLVRQKNHHPELALNEYRLIPEIVQKGKVIREKDARLYFFQRQDHLYMAAIKATEDKAENYLVTFFRVRPEHMRRKQRRGELIRDWQKD